MSQQISDISMKHYPTPSLCQNKISFPLQQAKHESCISFVWLKNDHSAERHTRCAFSGANDRTQSSYRQRVINRSRSGTSVNENPCICFGTRLESIDSAETFSCERLVGNHSFIKNTFLFTHTPQQDLIACIRRETRLPCFGESSDLFSSSFFFFLSTKVPKFVSTNLFRDRYLRKSKFLSQSLLFDFCILYAHVRDLIIHESKYTQLNFTRKN